MIPNPPEAPKYDDQKDEKRNKTEEFLKWIENFATCIQKEMPNE